VCKVKQEPRAHRELKVPLVRQDLKAIPEIRDPQGLKVFRGLQDLQDLKAILEIQVPLAHKEILEQLDLRGRREMLVHRVQ
jgi:hypothetical protein